MVCINFVWVFLIFGTVPGMGQPMISRFDLDIGIKTWQEDSQEIWSVKYVPKAQKMSSLLAPFKPTHRQWGSSCLSASNKFSNESALSVFYPKGSYSRTKGPRGAEFYSTPSELGDNVERLILMYDVYFEGFGWGRMGKLPGLFGGGKGPRTYECSGGKHTSTCFTLRLMWRENGQAEVYGYIPSNQEEGFSSRSDIICDPKYGISIGRGKISFRVNEWQTVMQEVHLNTPGKFDGYIKLCLIFGDGSHQCFEAENLNLRGSADHYIRGLYFSSFFEGSKPQDKAPNDCRTYFKSFRMKYPSSG